MKKDDLISIIVPVYNVENYLVNCLDSILTQTYSNLEIIIIDDGSTDNSSKLCDAYALKDERIKVYHQENQGLGPARNKGISMSRGQYLSFVDSDDYVHPRTMELLYESLQKNNTALSMAKYSYVYDYPEPAPLINEYETAILSRDDLIQCFYSGETSRIGNLKNVNAISVWSKLYRRELFDNLWFRNMYHEDFEISMAVYLKIKEAVFVNVSLYYWMQRRSSITHEPMNKRRLDVLSAYKYSIERIPTSEKLYRGMAVLRLFKLMLSIQLLSEKTTCKAYAHELIKKLEDEYRAEFFANPTIPLKNKIVIYLMCGNPALYRWFIKLCDILSKYNLHVL